MNKTVLFACLLAIVACKPAVELYDLRCEGLVEPLAIDSIQPHFSWKTAVSGPAEQESYEIQVAGSERALRAGKADFWASGAVASPEQVMIPYEGSPLEQRGLYWWRARIRTADGKTSRWSAPQRFGIGILAGMAGEYIGAVPGEGHAPLLRKRFRLAQKNGTALLHVNSLGYHEAYVNGQAVSDAVLTPAVSQLDKRSLIVTYDVTSLLKKGENEIVRWTSSGWYKPETFGAVCAGPLVRAELDLVADGKSEPLVWTDGSWEGCPSGYREYGDWHSYRFGGELVDAAAVPASMAALDDRAWGPVDVVAIDGIAASPQMCELARVQEVLTAQSVEPDGEGAWLVDFGRVVNAMPVFRLPALPAGHTVRASYTDNRTADGTMEFVGYDEIRASGAPEGDVFQARFNHHVFRYIRLENLPEAPVAGNFQARRMRTDYAATAAFHSSDEELNRIHDMIASTVENLAFDGYMVDCANIERLGYGGDGNASTQTLQILFATSPLYVNWLQAWIDAIREDGGLPHTAPNPYRAGGGPYWCSFIVQAPWRTFMNLGDPRLMERCYPTMKHWLDYVDAYTVDGLLQPWPDTDYRWWFLGDWAAPDGVDVTDPASVGLVNNCALCQTYMDLADIALLLGHVEDVARFHLRYDALAEKIHETYFHPETNTYASGSQIDMAYPLLVGVVPEELKTAVRDKLVERTETVYEGHLKTGLVGIPVLTEWATLAGECDFFYRLLKQHGYPGYLHMLDNGATGTWEHWNGRRSRLHNCFNGIGSWFYQALGGIIPDAPGYRHIRLEPQIPEGLTSVQVSQQTPYGTILVSREGRRLHFELPFGVTATVRGRDFGPGPHDVDL